MDDMKVMFVFIRVMLADNGPVNESYLNKMAFGPDMSNSIAVPLVLLFLKGLPLPLIIAM